MNNEIQTWRPWTPEEREAHEAALERINKLNEEIIKKGEIEARKSSIRNLREKIRQNAKDYRAFCNTPDSDDTDYDQWFVKYLCNEMTQSIRELKQLVEDKNE